MIITFRIFRLLGNLASLKRIAIGFLLWCAPMAWAICPFPRPSPCSLYFLSDAVFVGTVKSEWLVPEDKKHDDGMAYRLEVTRWFKGGNTKSVIVYTGNNSGREPLDQGKTYVVFATKGGDKTHPLVIGCYDTFSGEEFDKAIADTEGTIQAWRGHVLPSITVLVGEHGTPEGDDVIPNVSVVITGSGRSYRGTTDDKGQFSAQVPPGIYKVSFSGNKYEESFHSIYEARRLRVSYGQCAFLVMEKKWEPIH